MNKRKTGRMVVTRTRLDARVWTGDRLLDHMLSVAGLRESDLKAALGRTRDALDAERPTKRIVRGDVEVIEEGGPDHPTRLKAAEILFGLVGFHGKRERDSGDPTKPVSVTINLAVTPPEPRPALPPGRLTVHLTGNGHGNGHGGAAD